MVKMIIFIALVFCSCNSTEEKIKPTIASISESVYASGIIKSKNQYEVHATVNGTIDNINVSEGDTVSVGSLILSISNTTQRLNKENAELNEEFSDAKANAGKLNEANLLIELAKNKMNFDSALYFRQKNLWQQHIGSKLDLEQREFAYANSKKDYFSSMLKYTDLKKQIDFTSAQSKKNLLVSTNLENDYTIKSEINGIVYSLNKSKGDFVNVQTPIAIIGDAHDFILEMEVDESDILKIKKGLPVLVTLDSYKGKVFEAKVTKINPLMNERTQTFMIEAEFINPPEVLYPNITFEANIILQSKNNALLIPRNFLLNDSTVLKANGDKAIVKTGLKDYQQIEIISGVTSGDELKKPTD
ncbi:secretion protein HlyD [Bacteroidota bacterium]|nr:secretion protein HlyD [Bacteroidota bacterium]